METAGTDLTTSITSTSQTLKRTVDDSSPAIEKFIAAEKFKLYDGNGKAEVTHYPKIAYMSKNFISHYLPKVESALLRRRIFGYELTIDISYEKLIEIFGSAFLAETILHDLWQKLERQPNGEFGGLLVNGKINNFYIPDIYDQTCLVRVCYIKNDGWHIYMVPDTKNRSCIKGTQLFSHKFIQ